MRKHITIREEGTDLKQVLRQRAAGRKGRWSNCYVKCKKCHDDESIGVWRWGPPSSLEQTNKKSLRFFAYLLCQSVSAPASKWTKTSRYNQLSMTKMHLFVAPWLSAMYNLRSVNVVCWVRRAWTPSYLIIGEYSTSIWYATCSTRSRQMTKNYCALCASCMFDFSLFYAFFVWFACAVSKWPQTNILLHTHTHLYPRIFVGSEFISNRLYRHTSASSNALVGLFTWT